MYSVVSYHQTSSSKESRDSQGCDGIAATGGVAATHVPRLSSTSLLSRASDREQKAQDHHGTSKYIFCSHHQRRGTAPCFLSPLRHLSGMGRVATYTVMVCQRMSMYSAIVSIPHSFKTSSNFGYTHWYPAPHRGLLFFAIL
jgi:hypothetical protein